VKSDKQQPEKPKTDKQNKTEKPWLFQPGQSGNPKGRPKRKTLTEMIHAKLDEDDNWQEVVAVVLEKVLKDKDKEILKSFWDHTDGKAKQAIDHTTKGEKINPTFTVATKEAKENLEQLYQDAGPNSTNDKGIS